jgi:hypothetical protein
MPTPVPEPDCTLQLKHKDQPDVTPPVKNMCMTWRDSPEKYWDVQLTSCDCRLEQQWYLYDDGNGHWQIVSADSSLGSDWSCVSKERDTQELKLVTCNVTDDLQLFQVEKTTDLQHIRFKLTDYVDYCMDVGRAYIESNPGWMDLNMISNCIDDDEIDEHLFVCPHDDAWWQ